MTFSLFPTKLHRLRRTCAQSRHLGHQSCPSCTDSAVSTPYLNTWTFNHSPQDNIIHNISCKGEQQSFQLHEVKVQNPHQWEKYTNPINISGVQVWSLYSPLLKFIMKEHPNIMKEYPNQFTHLTSKFKILGHYQPICGVQVWAL